MTLILPIDPGSPDPMALDRAARVLREGGILAYPTDTLYGLGVDPFQEDALDALFRLKQRPEGMPVSILVRDMSMLERVAATLSPMAMRVIRRFLPGPVTVLLPAAADMPERLTGGTGKIGVRISPHPLMDPLFALFPHPITTTSANPAGRAPATDAQEIAAYFPRGLGCILDAGRISGAVASTVVDLTGVSPVILREGAVSGDAILRFR